ncbi:AAC(3) family N-acetyltransferase [Thioclava sp. BHET1]|nr:AAC(3) family N-acetyltransferase [Thioclava sp. BHET1]
MKILLIGVGCDRCSALHTAETLASNRRTKTRRFKSGPIDSPWFELPDVADDYGRLFPMVGAVFESSGLVRFGALGQAQCKVCNYSNLVTFASERIDVANAAASH